MTARRMKVEITANALVKRINRKLKYEVLKKNRAKNMRAFLDYGDYYLIDVEHNWLVERDVDIARLAKWLGVLPVNSKIAFEELTP